MTHSHVQVPREEEVLLKAVARLNANVLGVVLGFTSGFVLFLATLILVLKGGPDPGPHLALLSQYFPGYSVTLPGALVGALYAGAIGYAVGFVIGKIYNRIILLKSS